MIEKKKSHPVVYLLDVNINTLIVTNTVGVGHALDMYIRHSNTAPHYCPMIRYQTATSEKVFSQRRNCVWRSLSLRLGWEVDISQAENFHSGSD